MNENLAEWDMKDEIYLDNVMAMGKNKAIASEVITSLKSYV